MHSMDITFDIIVLKGYIVNIQLASRSYIDVTRHNCMLSMTGIPTVDNMSGNTYIHNI